MINVDKRKPCSGLLLFKETFQNYCYLTKTLFRINVNKRKPLFRIIVIKRNLIQDYCYLTKTFSGLLIFNKNLVQD